MPRFRTRLRQLDDARRALPRRKAYSIAVLVGLLLLVHAARPGGPGREGWSGRNGQVLGYVRCGWTNRASIHLNPYLTDRQRELVLVHEQVHVDDARATGHCMIFNLLGRMSARVRLDREARAHCAELRYRMRAFAYFTASLPDPERRRRREAAWRHGERRIVTNLMSAVDYAGIAELGWIRVAESVRRACTTPIPSTQSAGRAPADPAIRE